ncbi:hypothetical protein [Paraliomyxa miuraensis]|uniref:hypothetical protein n=1 Tax=Paraliomyxa miuraensis TaxID=376150 RepID=UPI0022590684|nr:hypothetical protein [Paraliomyxa miuraensis]MCX4243369.1 hypothetical protein [Paraliomyxa miuraensis]
MTPRSLTPILLALASPVGCQCADADIVEIDADASSGSAGESSSASSSGSDRTTGDPFDASRWIDRYHFEHPYLPFGERGDPLGTYVLVNFEVFPDARASMFYDGCGLSEGFTIAYRWSPSENGWLSLRPGEGETTLRFLSDHDVDTLRVRLTEPCRELRFEVDGELNPSFAFFPGASCWVDRCTTPGIMQVDYCDGEEPTEPCD